MSKRKILRLDWVEIDVSEIKNGDMLRMEKSQNDDMHDESLIMYVVDDPEPVETAGNFKFKTINYGMAPRVDLDKGKVQPIFPAVRKS